MKQDPARTALLGALLRRELVFVDQPTEQVAPPDTIHVDYLGDLWGKEIQFTCRRGAAVGPLCRGG